MRDSASGHRSVPHTTDLRIEACPPGDSCIGKRCSVRWKAGLARKVARLIPLGVVKG